MADTINTSLLINGNSAKGIIDSSFKFTHDSLWEKIVTNEHYELSTADDPNALQVVETEDDMIYVDNDGVHVATTVLKSTLVENDSETWNDVLTDGSVYVLHISGQVVEKEKYLKATNSYSEEEIDSICEQAFRELGLTN